MYVQWVIHVRDIDWQTRSTWLIFSRVSFLSRARGDLLFSAAARERCQLTIQRAPCKSQMRPGIARPHVIDKCMADNGVIFGSTDKAAGHWFQQAYSSYVDRYSVKHEAARFGHLWFERRGRVSRQMNAQRRETASLYMILSYLESRRQVQCADLARRLCESRAGIELVRYRPRWQYLKPTLTQ